MEFLRKLPIPQQIKNRYPVTEELKIIKEQRDEEIKAIFRGESDKFILIIGPCSADNKESVLVLFKMKLRIKSLLSQEFTPISQERRVMDIKVCCISLIPMKVPIC